jgi:hypothetical protein
MAGGKPATPVRLPLATVLRSVPLALAAVPMTARQIAVAQRRVLIVVLRRFRGKDRRSRSEPAQEKIGEYLLG